MVVYEDGHRNVDDAVRVLLPAHHDIGLYSIEKIEEVVNFGLREKSVNIRHPLEPGGPRQCFEYIVLVVLEPFPSACLGGQEVLGPPHFVHEPITVCLGALALPLRGDVQRRPDIAPLGEILIGPEEAGPRELLQLIHAGAYLGGVGLGCGLYVNLGEAANRTMCNLLIFEAFCH